MNLVNDQSSTPEIDPVVLKDQRAEKPRNRDRRLVVDQETRSTKLITEVSSASAPVEIVNHVGEPVSSLTWKGYLAWRKTKCRPYNYEAGPEQLHPGFIGWGFSAPRGAETMERSLEELDQATHELVGEVAELGQLFLDDGPYAFFGDARCKLIDECGDIFFCAAWALDAWGLNPLYEADDLEIMRVHDDSEIALFARCILVNGENVLADQQFVSMFGGLIHALMLAAQTNAGLLCNSFKKLRFQRREQSVEVQIARIASVLITVNQVLVLANSSVEEALQTNQRKLNARFPNGYQPGQGGGIRTGEGK